MIKNDISTIPFENLGYQLRNVDEKALLIQDFIKTNKLASRSSWVLPQLLAEINTWKILVNEDGTIDGNCILELNTTSENTRNNFRVLGIIAICTYTQRSELMTYPQHHISSRDYCKLVPIILSAFKKFRNIPYSKWTNTQNIIESSLYEAMHCEYEDFDSEELLQLRVQGMYYKDPSKKPRNPMTTYGLFNVDGRIHTIPMLAKIMLTQIWCAHPANRNQYMVLNPKNWDEMPAALVSHDVLISNVRETLPWEKTTKSPQDDIPPWERK